MQKRNIYFVCALFILACLVFSPISASAGKFGSTYGSCKTSKWGVTVRADFHVYFNTGPFGNYSAYKWKAKVTAWGKGARVGTPANAVLNDMRYRQLVRTYKGWHIRWEKSHNLPYAKRNGYFKGGMGIDMWQGNKYSRQRCTTNMRAST